jgi:hypothetical protein
MRQDVLCVLCVASINPEKKRSVSQATRQRCLSFLGKQTISTHDEKNELETLNDTESDENAAGKKALTLEIKAHDDNSNLSTSNQG